MICSYQTSALEARECDDELLDRNNAASVLHHVIDWCSWSASQLLQRLDLSDDMTFVESDRSITVRANLASRLPALPTAVIAIDCCLAQ